MAKRYKEKKRKKKKIFFLIIVIVLLIVMFFVVNKKQSSKNEEKDVYKDKVIKNINESLEENSDENKKNNSNIKLSSNLVIPEELNKDVISKVNDQLKEAELVKIQYQLINLDDGEIELFYKAEDKIVKIKVDIKEKSIINIEEIKDDELLKKSKIQDNIKEDIAKDFEENKELLNEEKVLNIIITDTEVIISITYI